MILFGIFFFGMKALIGTLLFIAVCAFLNYLLDRWWRS
jgi:hypothetical protein